jgi:trimeric autotransporter adhesin
MKSYKTGLILAAVLVMAALGFMSCSSSKNAKLISIKVTPVNPVAVTDIRFEAAGEFSDGNVLNFTSEVSWSSSDPTVATVGILTGSIGHVTILTTGVTTITAVEPFNHFTSSSLLTVVTPSSITITPENPIMATGRSHEFAAIANFVSPYTAETMTQILVSSSTLTWDTSDPLKATVSKHGLVTAGKTTTLDSVIILVKDTLFGTELSSSATLTITPTPLKSILVTSPTATWTMLKGESMQLTATGTYEDTSTLDLTTSVEWFSKQTGTVVISNLTGSKGIATAVGVGKVDIKATDPISKVTGSAKITVIAP